MKEYMHPYDHWSIIHNSQAMEAAQVLISRWVDKKAVVHIYNEILLHHKNRIKLPLARAWVDLEGLC